MNKFTKLIKKHWLYIFILVLVILFNLHNFIGINCLPTIDHSTTYLARAQILKNSIEHYGNYLPLWNPYLMGGSPFFDYPGSLSMFSITGWLVALFDNLIFALNLNYVLAVIMGALAMYILVYYLTKNAKAGLIGGMIYGLAGPMIRLFHHGALTQMNGLIITPLLYLFMVRASRRKNIWSFVNNMILLGILFALQVRFNPDLKIVMFTGLMFGLFLIFQMITTKQLIRMFLAALIVGSIFLGLSAQKIMPAKEFLDFTSRGHLSYEQSASRKTEIKDLFKTVIEPFYPQAFNIRPSTREIIRSSKLEGLFKIGIVAFILILCALFFKYKNMHVIFLTVISLFALSITTGSFIFYLLWQYVPPFDSFRYLGRVYSLFLFAAAALAGLGTNAFLEKIKWKKFSFIVITGLLILNLAIFNIEPTATYAMTNVKELIDNTKIMEYISQDNNTFRIHIIETNGIDWTTEYLQIPHNLEMLYGEETAWQTEYMNIYLGMGLQQPAKFWGILNTKYVTSTQPLKIEGLQLVKKFDNCTICPPIEQHLKAFGPYLYENKKVMPRGYILDKAILIIGEKEQQMQVMYGLLLNEDFDPSTTLLIYGKKKIKNYNLEELKRYKGIILTTMVNQKDLLKLKQYKDAGGKIIPDIVSGKIQIVEQDIANLLRNSQNMVEIVYKELNFDHKKVQTYGKRGWLVISEKFSSFPGWHTVNVEKEIYKANGIVSAVWLDGTEKELIFEYKPRSYVIGTWLMILTLIVVITYSCFYGFYLRKK